MAKILKYILFIFLLAALFLPEYYVPFFEKKFGWQAGRLGGAYGNYSKPIFTPKGWLSGKYQREYFNFSKFESPIRELSIRSRNQFDYDVLNTIGNKQSILGKDDFLFDRDYVNAFVGQDFIGEDLITEKLEKLKIIQKYYKSKGLNFLVLLPPGKPHILPEKLPNAYQNLAPRSRNRTVFIEQLKSKNIPFIDFEFFKYFQKQNEILLYPQAGLHWNYYGVGLAADTIRNYVENQFNLPMPKFLWKDSVTYSTNFKSTDDEILRGANLLNNLKLRPEPYPGFRYQTPDNEVIAKALVVGDSYYEILVNEGIHENLFAKESWYYHYFKTRRLNKSKKAKPFTKNKEEIFEQLESSNLVILEASERNLPDFGFGFIDFVFEEIGE